ncbi:MAG: DNA gyrase inhibitor YacG [Planctomycetes bacterium]|nr:DNA gyrase inhibitor YacG [Planctomycetota bacterium]
MRSCRCSICGTTFVAEGCATVPFCSERCRSIDLAQWLGEAYGLPVARDEGMVGDVLPRQGVEHVFDPRDSIGPRTHDDG